MTFDEIVAHYRKLGETNKYFANAKVWKRSELNNKDLNRSGCICGGCWARGSKLCVCGEDVVIEGRICLTCNRPSWCTT